ncbi:MAG: metal ABC transporter ATP-binding protein [Solobacterium sp.]|nr:metal ABC transporter ATP-binding protein [Solobacterium sp.]
MALITVKDLALGYEGQKIVGGLTFEVRTGDYLCIVGENGSGKTTLMKTLLKLQDPLSGTIELGDGLLRNEIGYLPQQTLVQKDFPASVREVVLSGCLGKGGFHPFYTREEKALADKQMERMEVLDLADRSIRDLSGGQQQRVLLARALCAADKVLVLDEPVSGLDPRVTEELYTLIEKLNKGGITVIMISHDIDAALKYASHILHIGKTVFFGTKEDYLKSETGRQYAARGGEER